MDGLKTIAERINRLGRIKTAHRPATTRSEERKLGDRFSRTVEEQQLVLDEHRFGDYRAGTVGTSESGNGRQQMQKTGRPDRAPPDAIKIPHGKECSRIFGIRHAQDPG